MGSKYEKLSPLMSSTNYSNSCDLWGICRMIKKAGTITICVLAVLCVFCGGCIDTTGESTQTDTGTVPPTECGLRLITEEFKPFSYLDENGRVAGQSTEVVQEILRRLEQTGTIELLPWEEGYDLTLKTSNVVLFPTARTAERKDLFQWVGPIASFDSVFYAKNGSGIVIQSLDAAKKTGTIGAVTEDVRYQYLVENNVTNLVGYESDEVCVQKLMDGEIDLWLGSSSNYGDLARSAGYTSRDIEAVYSLRTIDTFIAFSQGTSESVVATWQDALDAIKEDGTFAVLTSALSVAGANNEIISTESGPSEASLALSLVIAETNGTMTSVLRTLEVLAVTSEVRSGDWQEIKPLLAVPEEKIVDARMWYARTNGSYYTVVDDLAQANLLSRPYFPQLLAGQESVGTVVVSHSTGKSTAIVAVPVKTDISISGILGASVYLDSLVNSLESKLPGDMTFFAIAPDGTLALSSEKGEIFQNVLEQDVGTSFGRAVDKILAEDSGVVTYDAGGMSWTAYFRTSPLTGWHVVVAYPE